MKKIFTLLTLLVMGLGGAWADQGDVIYSNDFSSKDQTDFATWTAVAKKPTGYTYAQIGRAGSFSTTSGALVFTAATGKDKSNVYNASVGVFNSSITTATASKNYDLSFDVTLSVTSHIAHTSFIEFSDESKKVVLTLYATHTRANSSTGATTYGYIVGGDNGFQVVEAGASSGTNAEGTIGNGTQNVLASNIKGTTGSKTYNVTLKAETSGIGTLTIKEGENTIVDGVQVNLSKEKGLKYITFEGYNTWQTTATEISLDNLSIVEGAASTAATANYTVNYVCDGNSIKTSDTRSGVVGQTVTLTPTDVANFFNEGNTKKYIYVSDNASSTSIAAAGTSVVTVNFREADTYSYTVKNSQAATITSGSNFEGESVSYPYARYINVDGTLYSATKQGSNPWWGKSFTLTQNNQVETVSYTASDINNVVYFAETEDIAGATKVSTGNADIRCSNKAGGFYEGILTTLQPGKYKLTTSVWGNKGETIKFKAGEATILEQETMGYIVDVTSEEFSITVPTEITISGGNASESAPKITDYIYIQKTGDAPTSFTKTLGSHGYGTFSASVPVIRPKEVVVYTSTYADNTLTAIADNTITVIPANTGVIVKGEANAEVEFQITTDPGTTIITALTAAPNGVTGDGVTTYGLLRASMEFAIIGNGVTLPANYAYLVVPSSDDAKSINFVVEENTTAISNVNVAPATNSAAYNLAGQRVNANAKGVVIINGKKYMNK